MAEKTVYIVTAYDENAANEYIIGIFEDRSKAIALRDTDDPRYDGRELFMERITVDTDL